MLSFKNVFIEKTIGKIELGVYENDADLLWKIDSDCSNVTVDVTRMATEYRFDWLYINDEKFSGFDPFKVKSEDSFVITKMMN